MTLVNKTMFQGYNSIIHHLYVALCVYHSQSPSITIYPSFTVSYFLLPPFPSGSHLVFLCCCFVFVFCLILPPVHPGPLPPPLWQLITSSFNSTYPHSVFKDDDSHHPHKASCREENKSFPSCPFSTAATADRACCFWAFAHWSYS